MKELKFVIKKNTYNNKEFECLYIVINDKSYYLGTLKEFNEFCYIQTKSKKKSN